MIAGLFQIQNLYLYLLDDRISFKFKIHTAPILARCRLAFACSIVITFFPLFFYVMGWRLLEYQPRLISALMLALGDSLGVYDNDDNTAGRFALSIADAADIGVKRIEYC